MPLQNQISLTFEQSVIEQIRSAVKNLEVNLLPKLVQLDTKLRKELPKMGDNSVAFVTKAIEYAETNPALCPQYLDLKEAKVDFDAVKTLREFSSSLEKISAMVDDTMTLSGSEAYSAALAFYNAAKGAAKARQPGAQVIYEDLKSHFPRTTQSSPETPKA